MLQEDSQLTMQFPPQLCIVHFSVHCLLLCTLWKIYHYHYHYHYTMIHVEILLVYILCKGNFIVFTIVIFNDIFATKIKVVGKNMCVNFVD